MNDIKEDHIEKLCLFFYGFI